MLKYARLAILIMLFGCNTIPYTAYKINMIELGMSKQQVIGILGEPVSTSSKDNITYVRYFLHDKIEGVPREQEYSYYFVRLVDGKVESYGKLGDFNSTIPPTVRIEKDETIKQDTNIKTEGKPDLYNELQKLKELKEQGLLTNEEFELKKKEILKKY